MGRVLPSASFRSHGHRTDSSSVVVSTYGGHHSDITRWACELAGEAGLGPVSPIMGVVLLEIVGQFFSGAVTYSSVSKDGRITDIIDDEG